MNEMQTTEKKPTVVAGFSSLESVQLLLQISDMFNQSTLVPEAFRGPKNRGNCAIAINMAQRMGADPLMTMQNLYVVYGTPAWSSKFMIAMFNQCGRYSSIKYEETGTKGTDSQGVRAYTTELSTGERITGPEVTLAIAKKEGWSTKNGSKWLTMPDQMLRYRAAAWLIRTTAPELSMGLQTQDEVEDIQANKEKERWERNVTPPPQEPVMLEDAVKAKTQGEMITAYVPKPTPQPVEKKAPAPKKAAPAPRRAAYEFNEADLPPMAPPPEEPNF